MAKNVTIFPSRPFNGMKFTDQWRRRWIYRGSQKSWVFDGFVPDIPLADSNTIGLLSPRLKTFLNSLTPKAGGFGVVLSNSFGKVSSSGYEGVVNGNIKLVSNSLDINCQDEVASPELGRFPSIDFNFSEDFLDTLCIEVPGCPGPKGRKGAKGEKGKNGTGNGPQGSRGTSGVDATGISVVSDVQVDFDDSFYNAAITDVVLDEERAILSATKIGRAHV